MTYEKILEVFADYLFQDDSCEVLQTSRGPLVMDWSSGKTEWFSGQLCRSPAQLRDVLRSHFEEYEAFLLGENGTRDVTEQEEKDIEKRGAELAARCESGG